MLAQLISRLKTKVSSLREWPPKALKSARLESAAFAHIVCGSPRSMAGSSATQAINVKPARCVASVACLLLLVALSPDPAFWHPYHNDFARPPQRYKGFVNVHVQKLLLCAGR